MSIIGNPIMIGTGVKSTIIVTGSTITNCTAVSPRGVSLQGVHVGNTWTFNNLSVFGTYVVAATDGTTTKTQNVLVDEAGVFNITITFIDARLRMYATAGFSLSTATPKWNGTMEYSTDGTTWNTWTGSSISAVYDGTNHNIYLRGSNNTRISSGDPDDSVPWVIAKTGSTNPSVRFEGSIEALLDWEEYEAGEHPIMNTYCFRRWLANNAYVVGTPEFTNITTASHCFDGMFEYCTRLTEIPDTLSAMTLTTGCYMGMFNHCTSLTTTLTLPATVMISYCYSYMFASTAVTTPTLLPSTQLAEKCYHQMYEGCSSLTTLPCLPATTLVSSCYERMFDGCTSIKLVASSTSTYNKAWRIPTTGTISTTPTDWNYKMFYNCTGVASAIRTPSVNTTYYTNNDPI